VPATLAQLLKEKKYILSSADGKILSQVSKNLIDQLKGFNKAADHNLNYLEQYFEHDLWLALSQDQASMRLSKIVVDLEQKCTTNAFTAR
jgi:hypothetical protein